jgi:hypothetical protein
MNSNFVFLLSMVLERGRKGASGEHFMRAQCTVHILAKAECAARIKMRLKESSAKYRYLKKLTCNGTLRQVFYLSLAPSPSLHTIYVYTVHILIHTGKGEGES